MAAVIEGRHVAPVGTPVQAPAKTPLEAKVDDLCSRPAQFFRNTDGSNLIKKWSFTNLCSKVFVEGFKSKNPLLIAAHLIACVVFPLTLAGIGLVSLFYQSNATKHNSQFTQPLVSEILGAGLHVDEAGPLVKQLKAIG